jgi:hypothetical protein
MDIIVQQPATARFLARHLYTFFVADVPQVPSWHSTPPRDPAAVQTLAQAYTESHYDLRAVLRVLCRSAFCKQARFARVKSPAELVIGTVHLAGHCATPRLGFQDLAWECAYQGQELLTPPSVESWHTGPEWSDGGALVRRVNVAAKSLGDTSLPGIRAIIAGLRTRGTLSPAALVDGCLDLVGPLEVSQQTRGELLAQAEEGGDLRWQTERDVRTSTQRVGVLLALIGASREYQLA